MNVEFHYYSTAFLAVKAGFSLEDASVLAYSSQFVDHHHRTLEIQTASRTVTALPTQNYAFWDQSTVDEVLAPFHFLPAGAADSLRTDARTSLWDVRPNSPNAKELLVGALKSRDLYRIGLALHTFSDTWAHQNFTARNEDWNRFGTNRLPAPGHAQAGWSPDLWLAEWDDPRLKKERVVNLERFLDCAGKVYRYLRTFLGKTFEDESQVLDELRALIEAGRGRDSVEDRAVEFILLLNLEPYDKDRWLREALEEPPEAPTWAARWKKLGQDLMDKAGLAGPYPVRAKEGFERSHLARWLAAAETQRAAAQQLIQRTVAT